MATILVIAEEETLLGQLDTVLRQLGHRVTLATEAQTGWMLFESARPNITLLSLDFAKDSGMAVLWKIRAADPEAIVIGLTGQRQRSRMAQPVSWGPA